MKRHLTWFAAALATALLQPSAAGADATVTPVFAGALPNVPGNNLNSVLVEYRPGDKSQTHYHAGSVFAYVLTGEIGRTSASAMASYALTRPGLCTRAVYGLARLTDNTRFHRL